MSEGDIVSAPGRVSNLRDDGWSATRASQPSPGGLARLLLEWMGYCLGVVEGLSEGLSAGFSAGLSAGGVAGFSDGAGGLGAVRAGLGVGWVALSLRSSTSKISSALAGMTGGRPASP